MDKFMNLSDEMIKNLEYYMPKKKVLQQLADFFGIFSDGTRLKILSALSMGRMCVNDISKALSINQTTVSHQLKTLKSMGIVKNARFGKVIFYELSNQIINDVLLNGVDYLEANIV